MIFGLRKYPLQFLSKVIGWNYFDNFLFQSDPTAINKLKAALTNSLATAQETGERPDLT